MSKSFMSIFEPEPDSTSLKHKRPADDMGDRAARMNPSTYKVLQIPALPDDIYLPPLPPIGNKDIEKRVFTHSSMISQARARVKFVEEDHELLDNEKLEWVGDGILKMVSTTLLHRLFPNMKEGPTTTIMSHLVSNATLAQISERYHLIDRLQVPSHAAMLVKSGEKSKANVFESYIAGLFQSFMAESGSTKRTEGQAFDYASEWLTPLFAPIAEYIRSELQAEQQRLSAPNNDQNGEVEIDAAEATGSSAMLNEYCIGTIKTGMPVYETETTEGLMWRTTCRIKLRGGEEVSAETVQSGKQPGKNVSAYKILLKLGLAKKPE